MDFARCRRVIVTSSSGRNFSIDIEKVVEGIMCYLTDEVIISLICGDFSKKSLKSQLAEDVSSIGRDIFSEDEIIRLTSGNISQGEIKELAKKVVNCLLSNLYKDERIRAEY